MLDYYLHNGYQHFVGACCLHLQARNIITSLLKYTVSHSKGSNFYLFFVSFSDLTFFIVDFDNEDAEVLKNAIESHGGLVVYSSFKASADSAVGPLTGAELSQTATEIVTHVWIVSIV
jgi:hypothetical protein